MIEDNNRTLLNLTLSEGVITTPTIDRTLYLLDPYFHDSKAFVTSGLRTAKDQLNIIKKKVLSNGIDKIYSEWNTDNPSVDQSIDFLGKNYYWWQRAWSKLLSIGEIVNPPLPAEVLLDYFRPGSTINLKGRIIGISNHMAGNSFDIGGGTSIEKKAEKVEHAKKEGNCYIHGYLVEKVNNAIHVDCEPINI